MRPQLLRTYWVYRKQQCRKPQHMVLLRSCLGAELKKEIIRNAELYGYSDLLVEVRILPWTVAEVSSNLDKYRRDFRSACQSLVDEKHVSAIIIGGGPLTGIASAIGTELSIPIYDGVQSAVSLAKTSLYKGKN